MLQSTSEGPEGMASQSEIPAAESDQKLSKPQSITSHTTGPKGIFDKINSERLGCFIIPF